MRCSTIFRTVPHFYFNYHYAESPLPYLHSSFTRRVQFAIQGVAAFLIGGFIAYGTALGNQLSQKFLLPLVSIMVIQDTVGLTLAACLQMLLAIVPTTIFLYVVQKIGLGYHDYLAAELILLFSTFIIAFFCAQTQSRKMPLVLCAIFFATIVNTPVVPSTFIFTLLESFVIAMAIGILVSLTVFPAFTTMDIENRVNYCLLNLQEMQTLIVQAFLRQDQMSAQIALTRASTIEQMIRLAMGPFHMKLTVSRFEPSRCLQYIFNRRRRHFINLTVQEQVDIVLSWFLHVRSMRSMVQQCRFNDYHNEMTRELESSFLQICSCQSIIISSMTRSPSMTNNEFLQRVSDLDQASEALRTAYGDLRFKRVQSTLESVTTIQSEDHLPHAFFLFQMLVIARLLTQGTTTKAKKASPSKQKSLKERLKPKWSRFFSAFKSMMIIGVGSIFVMVPALAKVFENGQWIFIALCMSQGDSVGGAFTTMKLRLLGTLLGAMWAYITYLSVYDDVYKTFGMLVPWIMVFSYIRPVQNWSYAAVIAAITPILINLGRIPYGNALPAGNFALLRIEENLVGIGVAIVLTIIIFPVFAIDLLKDNIQTTLQACRDSVNSMRSIYNELFHLEQLNEVSVNVEQQEQTIKSFFDAQRDNFQQLISAQRILIEHVSAEPSFWWFNNNFSKNRYNTLVLQEIDLFQVLNNIDTALIHIKGWSTEDGRQLENIYNYPAIVNLMAAFHSELAVLCSEISDCLSLWSSYFALTQTRVHRFFTHCTRSSTKIVESDLLKHEQHLIELHQTVQRLQNQHQDVIHRILEHYREQLSNDDTSSTFVPSAHMKENDSIVIAISALYFSTSELARTATTLGISIHNIFELETTHRYTHY